MNLAPVLDVYSQPGNFIDQYGRSYSQAPATVAQLGADFIRAQQQAGVAATAKHFPGLGTATRNQDTDLSPVTLNLPLSALRSSSRAALPVRDQSRREAGDGLVGPLSGARPVSPGRPVCRPWSGVSCASAWASQA